ncbi:MAG: hypothetical protein ACU0AZ_08900 [Paracoccaceae bacterium]|jgi:hypothetical protein
MDGHESHIKKRALRGQTSEQLAERNSLSRLAFYGGLGAVAFGIIAVLIETSFGVPFVVVGAFLGIGLAVAIEEKMKRQDNEKHARLKTDLANEQERELQARIKAAKENGDFDRWKTSE